MDCDEKDLSNISSRKKITNKLLKSAVIMEVTVKISFHSKTIRQSSDSNELCDRLKFLLQEKQAKKFSIILNEENDALANKKLEYKRVTEKQHRFLLVKCVN